MLKTISEILAALFQAKHEPPKASNGPTTPPTTIEVKPVARDIRELPKSIPEAPKTESKTRPTFIGNEGLRLIKAFEGCKLHAYRDSVGILTIGYGHTTGVKSNDAITQQQADEFLVQDLETAAKAVHTGVNVPLNQNQFDALCAFVFNVGSGRFNKSTMRLKLNLADYKGAAEEFLRWDKADGTILLGLTRRRKAEKELFEKLELLVS